MKSLTVNLTEAPRGRNLFRKLVPPSLSLRKTTRVAAHILLLTAYLFPVTSLRAQAPRTTTTSPYTSIVVFGDSLSDTGNDATVSASMFTVNAQVPGPATGYTNGRFTDGTDTVPAARNYNGVWIEQLAAKLTTHPVITNSLAGGTNYAYGFATTDVGTSIFSYGPSNVFSFSVQNMGLQLSNYLATHPTINSSTLFVVWGGANDLINATSPSDIVNAATRDVGLVQQLIAAGATDIVVPNLPPLGLVPRFNGSTATSGPPTAAAQGYNQALAAGLAGLAAANPGKTLHIFSFDVYTLFNTIVGPPIMTGFANVTASAQGLSTINPDTYLFWDDLHPTTFGHSLIANAAATLIGPPVSTTTMVTSSNANANLYASVTLTASVTATTGTPMGTVTFMDGSTTLGSGLITGSTSTATTNISTAALTGGTHPITAVYAGVNGYVSSTSPAFSEVIVPPSFTASALPSPLAVIRGAGSIATLSLTPAGGYTGSFTVACGQLPAHFSCALASASLSITGTSAATTTVQIGTGVATAKNVPFMSRTSDAPTLCALFGLSLVGTLTLRGRRARRSLPFLALIVMMSCATLGLTGCFGDGSDPFVNDAPVGTYTVPLTVTPATGSPTTVNISVNVLSPSSIF